MSARKQRKERVKQSFKRRQNEDYFFIFLARFLYNLLRKSFCIQGVQHKAQFRLGT
jgi:hypothetical protein